MGLYCIFISNNTDSSAVVVTNVDAAQGLQGATWTHFPPLFEPMDKKKMLSCVQYYTKFS